MNTQQIGTDIVADVSFDFGGQGGAFRQTYGFKGTVTPSGAGVYVVTINAGEGIDIDHAEINVYYGDRVAVMLPVTCLTWHVEELLPVVGGGAAFRITFTQMTFVPADPPAPAALLCGAVDVNFGSITIRRKVPAVNT